jgi:hypothetical protein
MPEKGIDELLKRLESAPARFGAALARFEDADSVFDGSAQDWTPTQVLAHVRASNDILEPRIMQVLVRDEPPLPVFDERRWCEVAGYELVPVTELLGVMRARRRELVRILHDLGPDEWERAGLHEKNGRITVLDIARHLADHDDEHIRQIEEAGAVEREGA